GRPVTAAWRAVESRLEQHISAPVSRWAEKHPGRIFLWCLLPFVLGFWQAARQLPLELYAVVTSQSYANVCQSARRCSSFPFSLVPASLFYVVLLEIVLGSIRLAWKLRWVILAIWIVWALYDHTTTTLLMLLVVGVIVVGQWAYGAFQLHLQQQAQILANQQA